MIMSSALHGSCEDLRYSKSSQLPGGNGLRKSLCNLVDVMGSLHITQVLHMSVIGLVSIYLSCDWCGQCEVSISDLAEETSGTEKTQRFKTGFPAAVIQGEGLNYFSLKQTLQPFKMLVKYK